MITLLLASAWYDPCCGYLFFLFLVLFGWAILNGKT